MLVAALLTFFSGALQAQTLPPPVPALDIHQAKS